ncbi:MULTISPECIES: nucleotidyltransferase family protein [unclassified Aureimonas]|uniref:nucleotidyltransferase family protein n=1 Tax=unclassified Aureimonas TaxID=2615206 RepID=UPI0006F2C557|nr:MULTISPECIES: nucleotidyltransferase domain-containing protein [unclassified Aureimonas]KQT65803.1 hypothetical protein ASG62_21790 [Aureimonas sp. Leaf427]KQT74803.1 hypothetical protein ASG54_16850 [Aureimonas sp. Leaf460]
MSRIGASMPAITTLAERKRAEALRRTSAADEAVRQLRAYAAEHRGRFVVFGSYVGKALRFDSDLDVLVDFPVDRTTQAWTFAESLAARYAIPLDIHDARTAKRAFVDKVLSSGLCLS